VSDEQGGGLVLLTIGLLLALHNVNLFSAYPLAYACSRAYVIEPGERLG
jgi:hypothetical protein